MDVIKEFWAVIVTGIGAVAWIVRLEARANLNSREVLNLQTQLSAAEARHAAQRAEDIANRERTWDQVNARLDGIQTDVKEVLQRTSR